MGGWGDDGVEWGKLYLGEGCCEDTEQEIVMGVMSRCGVYKPEDAVTRNATGNEAKRGSIGSTGSTRSELD